MAAFTALAIASLVSTGISAWKSHQAGTQQAQAGKDEQAAANDQAALQDYNAQVADLQASDAIARGTDAENRFRTSVRGIIGTQRAGAAANNVDTGFGSALDVQADAAYLGELDALQIRTNAAREAWGYKVQSYDLRKGADITRKEGANAAKAGQQAVAQGNLQAASTILGSTTSLLQAKYGFGKGA